MESTGWICCQIGSREHYIVPRILHNNGCLSYFITDAWVTPQSILNKLPSTLVRKLCERFHIDLKEANTISFTNSLIRLEINQRFKNCSSWDKIVERNEWFQYRAIQMLKKIKMKTNNKPTLFAYSYAARDILRFAKSQGWHTILGQIDPGWAEEQLVIKEVNKYPQYQLNWQPAPSSYWSNWKEECILADQILVNSSWSSQALQQVGVPTEKIAIEPLVYQTPLSSKSYTRSYPTSFSKERPLRVLFLGQVILRKGIAALLEAMKFLQHEPIELWIVGFVGIIIPEDIKKINNIYWINSVPRSEVAMYYQKADVFIFPTLSDGFGLTQLEAQAWKLPIIASPYCGEVVKDGINGLLLPEVSCDSIVQSLLQLLNTPSQLNEFSSQIENDTSDRTRKFTDFLDSVSHST